MVDARLEVGVFGEEAGDMVGVGKEEGEGIVVFCGLGVLSRLWFLGGRRLRYRWVVFLVGFVAGH